MANVQRPRSLPACDLCHEKKTRCDRKDPCSSCAEANANCTRQRPRQNASVKRSEQIDCVLERMGKLEEFLSRRFTTRTISDTSPPLSPASTELHQGHRASTSTQRRAASTARSTDRATETSPFAQTPEGPASIPVAVPPANSAPSTRSVPSIPSVRRNDDGDDLPASTRLSKRVKRSAPSQRGESTESDNEELEEQSQTAENHALATLDLSRYLKPSRPQRDRTLEAERQQILELAIRRAKQAMREPGLHTTLDHRVNFYDPSMYPSVELLYWLLQEYTRDPMVKYFMDTFGCVPPEVLEQYVLSLVNCVVHDQRRLQFIICANQVAYTFHTCFEAPTSPSMQKELSRSKERYKNNVVAALHHLDTSPRPDVPLLFALQSAALLMQDTGNMRRCWKLNTLACEVASSLQGCSISDLDVATDASMYALRMAYLRCFIFDTSLSANLYQPASLLDLQVDEEMLDTPHPSSTMFRILLSMCRVSEVIIRETKKCAAPHHMGRMDTARIARLQGTMEGIHERMHSLRNSSDVRKDEFLRLELLTMDCTYYSLMATIIRLSSSTNDRSADHECLENSRQCLLTLKAMLDVVSQAQRPDKFLSSLAWVVPLFPLRPIYFVFSNVIGSLDALDLKILQDLANSLDGPGKSHHSIMEVQRLCASLIDLYTQFSENAMYSGRSLERDHSSTRAESEVRPSTWWNQPLANTADGQFSNLPVENSFPQFDQNLLAGPDLTFNIPFYQQVDWELFYAQPELDFSKDLFE